MARSPKERGVDPALVAAVSLELKRLKDKNNPVPFAERYKIITLAMKLEAIKMRIVDKDRWGTDFLNDDGPEEGDDDEATGAVNGTSQ